MLQKAAVAILKTKGRHSPIGSNTVGLESGLFVNAKINGLDSKLLVDTGATLTLISAKLMEHIARQDTPELFPMERDVWDAGGNKMNVMGKGMFTFQISNFQCAVKAAVAELNVDWHYRP